MCCNELCTLSSCLPASSLKFICSPLHFVLCRLYNSHIMTLYKYMGSVSVKMFQDRRITDFELRLYILYAGKTWILYAAKYCLIVISHCLMYISRVACYTHLTLYTSVIENIYLYLHSTVMGKQPSQSTNTSLCPSLSLLRGNFCFFKLK